VPLLVVVIDVHRGPSLAGAESVDARGWNAFPTAAGTQDVLGAILLPLPILVGLFPLTDEDGLFQLVDVSLVHGGIFLSGFEQQLRAVLR